MDLSQRRAAECVRYLTQEKGIDPKRLVPKGKGETTPAKWKDPKTGKEIVLTEKYINQFKTSDPKLFEYLHQLNRRTEIRILKN
jgi:flagellar motor protein MotB